MDKNEKFKSSMTNYVHLKDHARYIFAVGQSFEGCEDGPNERYYFMFKEANSAGYQDALNQSTQRQTCSIFSCFI